MKLEGTRCLLCSSWVAESLSHTMLWQKQVWVLRAPRAGPFGAWSIIRRAGRRGDSINLGAHTTKDQRDALDWCVRLHASDVNYSRDWPALEEVDVVELVELDAELHGGLQLAHGYLCRCLPRDDHFSINNTHSRARRV